MKCKEHTRYQAWRKPVKTAKYPDGCPICWQVWEDAKVNPRRHAATVNIELDTNEARVLAIALSRSKDPVLNRFYKLIASQVRGI